MAAKPVITDKLALTLDLSAIAYTDKNGATITLREALGYFDSPGEAIGYAGSRKRALAKDNARKAQGAAPSRLYVNGNLPPEAADLAAQFRATMTALVPTMAPKAPAAPKAAPVPALDLSDPLEVAVSQELAPEPPKAKKEPKAKKARKLTPAEISAVLVDKRANGTDLVSAIQKVVKAKEPTPAAPVEAPPVVTPEVVKAIPPVTAIAAASGLDMAALRAKDAARRAARKAVSAS